MAYYSLIAAESLLPSRIRKHRRSSRTINVAGVKQSPAHRAYAKQPKVIIGYVERAHAFRLAVRNNSNRGRLLVNTDFTTPGTTLVNGLQKPVRNKGIKLPGSFIHRPQNIKIVRITVRERPEKSGVGDAEE